VAIVLAILLPIQALLPIATVQTGQAIIDAISIKHPFMSLFTLWLIATLLTQLLPALATLVQGILTDKLTGFINLSLMEKSKALISLAIFDDSEYFDDLCKGPR
jgi:ATP-binding cassette subfamily B protein